MTKYRVNPVVHDVKDERWLGRPKLPKGIVIPTFWGVGVYHKEKRRGK